MVRRPLVWRCAAEVGGTATLVGIGTGAVAAGARFDDGPLWLIALAWFVAVAIPVVGLAAVSGAHLNPAVTVALAAARRFSWREAGPYAVAQLVGAFGGSLTVLVAVGRVGRLGVTVPHGIGAEPTFCLEFGGTLSLVGSVLYLTGPRRKARAAGGLLPAAVVGVSTYLIGPWTGCSLNPARSIAPAVLSGTFTDLWVYLLAAVAAAVVGGAAARGIQGSSRRSRRPSPTPGLATASPRTTVGQGLYRGPMSPRPPEGARRRWRSSFAASSFFEDRPTFWPAFPAKRGACASIAPRTPVA